MDQQALQLSYAVEAVARPLAEWTVVAHAESDPTLADRYGGSWRRDWVGDVHARIQYLGQALAVRCPALLTEMCRWVADAPRTGRPDFREDLRASIACSIEVVGKQIPGPAGQTAAAYLAEALAGLDRPPDTERAPLRTDLPQADLRLELVEALLAGRREQAITLVDAALDDGLPLRDLLVDVLRPVLYDIGELWHRGEITVADEHFATESIRDILGRARPRFPRGTQRDTQVVASAVAGDLHDVGLRIVADLFELHGFPTTYLGANLPAPDLVTRLVESNAGLLALSVGTCMHLRTAGETIAQVRAACPQVRILVGGFPFGLFPELADEIGADALSRSPDEALELANGWFPPA